MGNLQRVERLRETGAMTVRDRIDLLVDEESFDEIGTFVVSERPEDRATTPGDGVIGGHAEIDGRTVTVIGDDGTVKAASTATMGNRRRKRLVAQALLAGNPIVSFGESAGARIPDTLGAAGATEMELDLQLARRQRAVPLVTVITGRSYGGSSFIAAHSDFVVQVAGTTMAITSPRLIETATGERVSAEELGGSDVHARVTGQADMVVDDDAAAMAAVRTFLGYLPQHAGEPAPTRPPARRTPPDPTLADVVPSRLQRAYDMHRVIERVVDDRSFFELSPQFGQGLIAGLARLDGRPVGLLASQPRRQAGALDPDACDKATRLVCLCDAYGLPLLTLQDVPGFMVGRAVEHDRLLSKVIMFQQALALSTVPKITVVLRKAFGLAYLALGGSQAMFDRVYAWPGSSFGFMDQRSGAQVVVGNDLRDLSVSERKETLEQASTEFVADFDAFTPAERMRVDEIIEPAETRRILCRDVERLAGAASDPRREQLLRSWPTRW